MSKMKTAELRKWIGKVIEWDGQPDARGWFRTYSGTLEDVCNRNVLVNNDWEWLPDMLNVRLKKETT